MKILHVIWRPRIGGAELFALSLARHQSDKHDIHIYYLGANDKELPKIHNVSTTAGGMRSGFDLAGLRLLSQFIKKSSFDVIHNHQNLPAIVAANYAVPNALHVRHEHGSNAPGWKSRRERLLSRIVNRWIPLYIANSESTRDNVIKYEHVKPEKIHVVPCGIEIKKFSKHEKRGQLRNLFKVPEEAPVIGFVGRLHPHKGVDDFLKVCSLIRSRVPEAHFIIAGDGPLREKIEKTIAEGSLGEFMHMAGFQKDVPEVLASYTMLLVPSRQEAQGLTAVEAMASGVPVVAFSVGGLPEVINDSGILINNRDIGEMAQAAIQLIEDSNLCSQIIEKGHKRAQQFDMDFITDQIINLYSEYSRDRDK